jgi:secondary thiamine-phosphate synthase enzyme
MEDETTNTSGWAFVAVCVCGLILHRPRVARVRPVTNQTASVFSASPCRSCPVPSAPSAPSARLGTATITNMRVFTDYLWFNTAKRQEFVRITDEIAAIVKKSGVAEGIVLVSAMHITSGVYVNDWEDGLIEDFQVWLEKLAPAGLPYRHHQTGEDNADAHLKRTIMGHQVIVPITNGALDLGPWEQVFYAEFDGRRKKRVVVKVMGM